MITYKTFVGMLDESQDMLVQQAELRNQAVTFANGLDAADEIIEICETAVAINWLFTVTVWYKQQVKESSKEEISLRPEEQSADVFARSLHEHERREIINTMITEHLIRSDSK
jgi:hypothetical protein